MRGRGGGGAEASRQCEGKAKQGTARTIPIMPCCPNPPPKPALPIPCIMPMAPPIAPPFCSVVCIMCVVMVRVVRMETA